MPDRRSRASTLSMHCGSSERLPLVSTIGRSIRCRTRWCSGELGNMNPSVAMPGATLGAIPDEPFAIINTIGAAGLCNSASSSIVATQCRRSTSRSRAISAKGLRSRRFALRIRETAPSWVASHASWNPPTPLIATM